MLVRPMRASDLAAVNAIYNLEVAESTATFDTVPTSPAQRATWFEEHQGPRTPALVAEEDDEVLGWACLSPWSDRCAYARAAEISVYVHRDARRCGVGRALLHEILDRARAAGLGVILARIVSEQEPSLALHRELGFTAIGRMRRVGEKFGRILDVDLLELHLDG
jgi:phosphinothricin acetyltransferase